MRGGSGVAEQSMIVERVEDADKEKKKKRRSNRRSKHNSVNEARVESSDSLKNGDKTKSLTQSMSCSSSSKQQGLETALNEQTPGRASDFAFSSMPTMHINEQVGSGCGDADDDVGGRTFSKSCPEPISLAGSSKVCIEGFFPFHQVEGFARKELFAPYWPIEAVNEALEKGEAFKALFRVNAHNRLEAYCKIDGVPTDVLISGVSSQNRAVEGDIVVIKVDPLGLWTKMKGSTGSSNNSAQVEEYNLVQEVDGLAGNSYKGKGKVDVDCEYAHCKSGVLLEKGVYDEAGMTRTAAFNNVNGHYQSSSDSSHMGFFPGQNEGMNSVDRLAAMTSQFSLKRPTGRVVAIVEKSPRRDAIVGFLNVKQWFSYRELHRKDAKKNSAIFDREYVTLTSTDPRFPKMIVYVRDLPDRIKKRLEDGDETIEMELVAAQIEDWSAESPFPQARVSHSFGRGGELEPQINAILYQNAIPCTDFPPLVLSCLPNIPWEIPMEEFQSRKDLRDLCVFTIDPSTASDLDDALSVERLSNGSFRIGVHIADVSYFVLPNTALDKEAQIRSTSVYMLQRKIQMLPSLLSEKLCSLNPGVDRLAFSIFWDLNSMGDVLDRWIGRTVIRSCCKLSYQHAQDIIEGTIDVEKFNTLEGYPQLYGQFEWTDVVRSVKCLHDISKTLMGKRFNDGALQLESSKVVYLFDECGVPYDCRLSERMDSNFLIEEFMLLANMTAAEVISRAFPASALLRRHPEPNMRKLKEFEAFCHKNGLALDTSSSGQFHQSLEKIREKLKDDSVLFDILISYASKPMQLATYFCSGELKDNLNDWGHYALAVPLYTHFTSPLRRYPDIVVHRTLAAVIEAEELYLKHRGLLKVNNGEEVLRRCFTGIYFDKEAAASPQGKEALSIAALNHGIPSPELLADVAAYSNERKLASRHAEDACEKLSMWVLLKKKEIFLSDARVLGLGPRFMSVYIQKLAIERRIYYDEVEGLNVEWLESTSTLVLNLSGHRRVFKRGGLQHYMALGNVAWVVNPYDLSVETGSVDDCDATCMGNNGVAFPDSEPISKSWVDPGTFPLTVRLLSTIPVALYAIGGDDGPLEIGVRLYMSSYLK
ncbi:Ribonuclease II/R - like 3 [Theobroma cacao]|nr:Ribonuclease II/R - like 3 [Theobroma cacao]